jgi:hypothetical protein
VTSGIVRKEAGGCCVNRSLPDSDGRATSGSVE